MGWFSRKTLIDAAEDKATKTALGWFFDARERKKKRDADHAEAERKMAEDATKFLKIDDDDEDQK
jgi:hypothetical protein